jgi:anti-sigma regulatory factor (Ser/Thr protein kinase)
MTPLNKSEAAMTTTVGEQLKLGPDAAARARRALAPLKGELPAERFQDVLLLVSELVTNSFRHAGSRADGVAILSVDMDRERIHVEVKDHGAGFVPQPIRIPSPDRESGWGLTIVDRIADRWGVVENGSTVVWFEIARN